MATITTSLSGSAIVNGTKNYTISDADLQILLNWAQNYFVSSLPASPTNQQILLAWIQWWIDLTKKNIQQANLVTTIPPAITVA